MALNIPSGFPIQVFIALTKDSLEKEIKTGFEGGQAIPLAEKFPRTNLQIKTKEEATVLKRLNFMYEDPNFGPTFFVNVTKLLRSNLRSYRMSRDNPQVYGHFFLCSKVAQGIIIHFNSVSRKNEILFLLTKEDSTGIKPLKLGIGTILKWHRNRKDKALKARFDEIKAIEELTVATLQAMQEYKDANSSAELFQMKFLTFVLNMEKELFQTKNLTRLTAAKELLYQKAKEGLTQYCLKVKSGLENYQKDIGSLDPGMFDTKEYLKILIDYFKNWVQFHLNEQAKIAHFLEDNQK